EISWGTPGEAKRPTKFTGKLTPGAGFNCTTYRAEDFKEDEAVAKELKRLEGRWMVDPKSDGVVIEDYGLKFIWGGNNRGSEAKFQVDPTKEPKEIDVVYTAGSENRQKRLGIYKLEDDVLHLVLGEMNGTKRPTQFAKRDSPGGGDLYLIYKLEKDK